MEWIAVGSPSKTVYDIKVRRWPTANNKRTPPLPPQKEGVLVKIVLRVDPRAALGRHSVSHHDYDQ